MENFMNKIKNIPSEYQKLDKQQKRGVFACILTFVAVIAAMMTIRTMM